MPSIIAILAKGIATAYGVLALTASVLYSLTRKDTWQKSTEAQVSEFKKGMFVDIMLLLYVSHKRK